MKKNAKEYYRAIRCLSRIKFINKVIRWLRKADHAEIYNWNAVAKVYLRDIGRNS